MNIDNEFIWAHSCPVTGSDSSTLHDRCTACGMPRPGTARTTATVMKYDAGKPPVDLIDPEFIFGIAKVLAFGAQKYAPDGWKKGMAIGKVLAAAGRHVLQRVGGEINDQETGLSHLYHAACELMFAAYYDRNSIVVPDDRFKAAK